MVSGPPRGCWGPNSSPRQEQQVLSLFPQPVSFPHPHPLCLVLVLASQPCWRSSLEPAAHPRVLPPELTTLSQDLLPAAGRGRFRESGPATRAAACSERVELSPLKTPPLTQGSFCFLLGLSRFFQHVAYETFYRKSEGRKEKDCGDPKTETGPPAHSRSQGEMKPGLTVISINI